MNIRIVTDSTSDLPNEIITQYGIEVVPNILVIDGKNYTDGIEITRDSFYTQLPNLTHLPTTATASVGNYLETYTKLFGQNASHIISIHPSARLSGIINAASTAAAHFQDRVTVVDSQQLSMGLGFQVFIAAQAAQIGRSKSEILTLIDQVRSKLRVVAMLDTLSYVHRSGRISWAKARLASFLNLRAFIELHNGKLLSLGETRTRRLGIERLSEILIELGFLEH